MAYASLPIDIEITSWADLNARLFENSWDSGLKRHRTAFAFRGLSSASYRLETSLARLKDANGLNPDPLASQIYTNLEYNILGTFQKYAYKDSAMHYTEWYWLALAQHHGLPTRLLDWTYSPYVALHFATTENFDAPSAIWAVNFVSLHYDWLPSDLLDLLNATAGSIFTVDRLQAYDPSRTLAKFDDLSGSTSKDFVIFFEPPSLDERIVNQFALFAVMNNRSAALDDWLLAPERQYLVKRFIIPAELKWEIRNKLDGLNIHERVLFPGLDGLSSWLKRYYGPPPRNAYNTENGLKNDAD